MGGIIKRIPFWIISTLIISIVCALFYYFSKDILPADHTIKDKVDFVTIPLIAISGILLAFQISNQQKQDYLLSEVLNQPILQFSCACQNGRTDLPFNSQSSKNDNVIILFDIVNRGNIPAKNLKIKIVHSTESSGSIHNLKNHHCPELVHNAQDVFRIQIDKTEFNYQINTPTDSFLVCADYASAISKTKYKKVWRLYCEPFDSDQEVRFYAVMLEKTADSKSITILNIFKNYWFWFLQNIGIHDPSDYTLDKWLINF